MPWNSPRFLSHRTKRGKLAEIVRFTPKGGHSAGPLTCPLGAINGSLLGANRANVRFGSLADITARSRHVRFTPNSGHSSDELACPFCASNRHPENRKRGTDRNLQVACIINLEFFQLSQKRVMPARLQHLQTRPARLFYQCDRNLG